MGCSFAQTDSIASSKIENDKYQQPIYDPETGTVNLSYNYSNRWDLDGDKKPDSLFFIGNGGAHVYFYLRVVLSTDNITRNFPFIQLDFPYVDSKESLDKYGKNVIPQFVVHDFDKDGIPDLYLNFDNHFGSIPRAWKKKGIKAKYVVMSFARSELKVRNY